jgi:hypothetical protein
MTIYHFTPDFYNGQNIELLSQEDCEDYFNETDYCFKYDAKSFEEAFNAEQISDLGYIRIF